MPMIGQHGVEIDLAVRNYTRVMWDDAAEAEALLLRVAASVPPRLSGSSGNPRLRLYRYGDGALWTPSSSSTAAAACSRW